MNPAARSIVIAIAALSLQTPERSSKIIGPGWSVYPSPLPIVIPE